MENVPPCTPLLFLAWNMYMMSAVQAAILDCDYALRIEATFKKWQNRDPGASFLLALNFLSLTSAWSCLSTVIWVCTYIQLILILTDTMIKLFLMLPKIEQ